MPQITRECKVMKRLALVALLVLSGCSFRRYSWRETPHSAVGLNLQHIKIIGAYPGATFTSMDPLKRTAIFEGKMLVQYDTVEAMPQWSTR